MSNNLKKNFKLLKGLSQIKDDSARSEAMKHFCSKECFRKALHEIAINVTHKDFPMSPTQKRRLRKYKRIIAPVTRKTAARKHYVQIGKGLPFLIPLISSLLAPLVTKAADKLL